MAEKSKQHLNGKVMGDHPLQKSAVEAIKREAVRLLLWFLLYLNICTKIWIWNVGLFFKRERERECVCLFGKPNGTIFAWIVYYLFRTSKDFSLSCTPRSQQQASWAREDFRRLFWWWFSIAQSVRPNGPWHTIKPRIEMCTTPKRNKKNQICVTDLFIYLTSSSVLFCFFFFFGIWSIDPTGGRDRWTHPVPSSSSDPAAGSWRIPPWSCKFWIFFFLNQKWMQSVS